MRTRKQLIKCRSERRGDGIGLTGIPNLKRQPLSKNSGVTVTCGCTLQTGIQEVAAQRVERAVTDVAIVADEQADSFGGSDSEGMRILTNDGP